MSGLFNLILGVAMLLSGLKPAEYSKWDERLLDILPDTQLSITQVESMKATELVEYYGQTRFFTPEMLTSLYEYEAAQKVATSSEAVSNEPDVVGAASTATDTPAITPTATEIPDIVTEAPAEVITEADDTVKTKWFSANVPAEVTTIKVNLTGGWNVPEPASTMLDDEGVLGCDDLADANANASCTWTGGADHQTAQGPVVGLLVPEGSYATAYAASFFVEGGGYTIDIPACGTNCAQGLLVRGWHLETHADKNLPITISKYGAVGAMKFTRYPVPAGAGQFFSQDYLVAQAENALSFDNCGIGLQTDVADCDVFIQHVFDFNDGSYTIMSYTAKDGWKLLWTNIVAYGRD